MKATKILKTETEPLSVASLPTRPTAPTAFGGSGYSSSELRAAFDKLPLLVAERYNAVLDDIISGAIADVIPTGIEEGHTIAKLLADITNGNLAAYLAVNDSSLLSELASIKLRLQAIERKI